ncbi:MAG TPA: cytochrome c [Kofleriaceae bacterium]
MRLPAIAFAAACSQASPAPPPIPKPVEPPVVIAAPDPAELNALAIQLEQGKQLFAEHCASCHGDTAQGTDDGPALVGQAALPAAPRPGAKRDVTFTTAGDVFGFLVKNMPADDPGTLDSGQYASILAFALAINGVKLERPLDTDTAPTIVLHP